MRLKQFKHTIYVAVTALALGVAALTGVDSKAATIKSEPQENTKQTVHVGNTDSVSYVTNLKINGKAYSKYKTKVKTVQTYNNSKYIKNKSNRTYYVDSEFIADTETYKQSSENYKYIAVGSYSFTFLKTGTYKISYDVYTEGDTKTTYSADGKSYTETYELVKTHHVDTYKVVTTDQPLKSITLGKNKITYTYKSSGTKTNVKSVAKYRYLQGKSGKLSIKTNSNYKLTSAYAVTYNAKGEVVVTATGNGKKVTYGTGKETSKTETEQYVLDANGNYTYVKDAAGNDTDEKQSQLVTTATSTSKYKPTTIYYGYKDAFTGSYAKFSVGTREVYVRSKDAKKHDVYEKNADGTTATIKLGNYTYPKYVVEKVTATVITKTYPERLIVDGAYKTVTVVEEQVILPGAKSLDEWSKYYLDATTYGEYDYTGRFQTVSKDGVNVYNTVTLEDGRVEQYTNPVYKRKFYQASYQGSWQPVTSGTGNGSAYADKTVDPKTGYATYTTYYQWVETYVDGQRKEITDLNEVTAESLSGSVTFNKQ